MASKPARISTPPRSTGRNWPASLPSGPYRQVLRMRIEGSHTLHGSPEKVYATLMDAAVLAECLPGCQQLVAAGEGVYDMKMKVALAALSGDFTGKVIMDELVPPSSYRLRVEGAGRIGFLNGQGEL